MRRYSSQSPTKLNGICKRYREFALLVAAVTLTGCGSTPSPAPVDQVYRGYSVHDYERASLSADTYQVQRGETLYSIAFRANMDMREIARLNNLQEPYTIFVGQTLRLRPAQGVSAPATRTATGANNSATNSTNGIVKPVASGSENEYGVTSESEKTTPKQTTSTANQTPTAVPPAPRVVATPPQQRQQASGQIRWQWPTQASVVRRFNSQEPGGRGLEFAGQRGEAIYAAAAGRVVYVGSALRGYGQLIILKHNDDYITAYGHNDEILVREQQWIEAGQHIATMGSSGRDDVRLRFELRFRGDSVNPENYLPRNR
ncbi:MAG: peptidoglycan DD-metalloendopeptidase family protein [Aliidiomarina sp.]|uniref:peptidoglycan DD-metalloendopeptidase family protein n=1 Tax=Aliidiomarina sp. TaxID=1872439 RepID=UPI0025BF2A80|nr:peptidoglycan DD-metalloendopeptidase family protein [Aliidiomarina sp.]MCH8501773.1 peptidoglycan DD-metalloendopeptidase family protein [Aliidiomarina sp.]